MYRQYDTDVATWSNDGRLYQVEYAMSAMNNGSCSIALRSNTCSVIVTYNRSPSDLAFPQNKVFMLNDNYAVAITGLNADGRNLVKFLREEVESHLQTYSSEIPMELLVQKLSMKYHARTYTNGDRPYGVGILLIGLDKRLRKQRVFAVFPNGESNEFVSYAIGGRSQSARTYLEKHFSTFDNLQLGDLVKQGMLSLKSSKYGDDKYGPDYISIVTNDGQNVKELTKEEKRSVLEAVGLTE